MNSKFFGILSFLLLFLSSFSLLVSAVDPPGAINQRMNDYVVSLTVDGDVVHVLQSFNIKSYSKDPIVPGFAKLVLFEGATPSNIQIDVDGSVKPLENYELVDGKPVIYYDIWRPITPGEQLRVAVSFDLPNFVKKGIFFNELDFEIGKVAVPIDSASVVLNIPKNQYISFNNPMYSSVSKKDEMKSYTYNVTPGSKISAEYSSLPLPTLPFNGYWMWAGFALICVIYFIFQAIRAIMHIKNSTD